MEARAGGAVSCKRWLGRRFEQLGCFIWSENLPSSQLQQLRDLARLPKVSVSCDEARTLMVDMAPEHLDVALSIPPAVRQWPVARVEAACSTKVGK